MRIRVTLKKDEYTGKRYYWANSSEEVLGVIIITRYTEETISFVAYALWRDSLEESGEEQEMSTRHFKQSLSSGHWFKMEGDED